MANNLDNDSESPMELLIKAIKKEEDKYVSS